MEVRRARPSDAAAIAAVHTQSWQAAYEHVFGAERLLTIDTERRSRWWERTIAEGTGTVLVAEHEAKVVAFVSVGASRDADHPALGAELDAVPDRILNQGL